MTSAGFQPEIVNNTINRNVVTSLYGLRGSWQATDKFKMDFDAYRSAASRPEGGTDTFVTAGLVSQDPTAPDILVMQDQPHSLPSLNVLVPPSQLGMTACPAGTVSTTNAAYCSYTALMNSGALNNNKYWSTHYDGLNGYSVHDQVTGFTLDGAWKFAGGPLDSILFGAGYSHREKTRDDISNDWTNGSGQYGLLYNTAGCPVQCAPYSFGSQGFNVISMTSPPHFMQGAGGSYPNVLPRPERRPVARLHEEPGRQAESAVLHGSHRSDQLHAIQLRHHAAAAQPVQLVRCDREDLQLLHGSDLPGRPLVRERRRAPGAYQDSGR